MMASLDHKSAIRKVRDRLLIGICICIPLVFCSEMAEGSDGSVPTGSVPSGSNSSGSVPTGSVSNGSFSNGNLLSTSNPGDSNLNAVPEKHEHENYRNIVAVDKALYLELIKLSRFNVQFHLKANAHQKWRSFTYPLGRESGTAVSFAGTLVDLNQQAKNLNHPIGISRSAIKDGIACNITGSAISGCSSGLELVQNSLVMRQASRQGFSPKDSVAFVKTVVNKTNVLLEERERLSAQEMAAPRRRVRDLETTLLKRIRQQLLFEFRTWSCHSRDQAWRENTFYAIDSAQSFLRMTASILARKTFDEPNLAGGSIVCALVSNSAATINPIFRNLVGRAVFKYQAAKLAKEFPCERPMSDAMSHQELKELQANHSIDSQHEELLTTALLLHDRSERIDVNLDRETKEIARYRQIAQQQSVSGPLIGLTGLTGSVLSAVAYFGYREEPRKAIKIGFPGRITAVTGQAYALLNTPYTALSGMRRNRRLKERGQLPEQILNERLKNLDHFEAQVRSLQPEL
jgi:hypothetical protein